MDFLNKKYTVIVAEDDILQREMLIHFIKEVDNLEIIASVSSGERLIQSYKRNHADIIVIDINLRIKDGITAAKELLTFGSPQIIIVNGNTNRENLLIGYELNFAGYIIKPIDRTKFLRCIGEAVRRTEAKFLTSFLSVNQSEMKWITFKNNYRKHQIPENLIVYIKKGDKYWSQIHLTDSEVLTTTSTLRDLQEQCSNNIFRSHKSYLVNIKYVKSIYASLHIMGGYDISLYKSSEILPLSKKCYSNYLATISST